MAAGGRAAGLQALADGTMTHFDGGGGQSPTQYPRWLNETASYEVPFVSGFEPWGIVYRYAFRRAGSGNPAPHWRTCLPWKRLETALTQRDSASAGCSVRGSTTGSAAEA